MTAEANTTEATPRQRRWIGASVQIVGGLVGLGLFAWVISVALAAENRAELQKLAAAAPWQIVAVIAVTLLSHATQGLAFWTGVRPVRRLSIVGLIATHVVAALLALVPFKLSVAFRVLVHHRRDRVPLAMIGGWFAAVSVPLFAVLGLLLLATLWRQNVDPLWVTTSVVGIAFMLGSVLLVARRFAGGPGLARLHRLLNPIAIGPLSRILRSEHFQELHTGVTMVASPRWLSVGFALRVFDLGLQALRLMLVASAAGYETSITGAVLLTIAYFGTGVLSIAGNLGIREAVMLIAAGVLVATSDTTATGTGDDSNPVAVIALATTAIDSAVLVVLAIPALLVLRPDRLLQRRAVAKSASVAADTPSEKPS
ncbi:MAG: lysylphosphatidylglycerol synthase domain-containing protein [Planctomycetota bacterium]